MDRNEMTGSFSGPPPNAPRETTQPLSDETLAAQLAQAQANERELAPFNPQPPADAPAVVSAAETQHAALNAAAQLLAERNARTSHQPAASETDSPSRGMPKPIGDPGKQVTGGFGSVGEAQYYAIDGSELQEVVRDLLDAINTRITNDLRFSLAITYPRLTVRLKLEVEGWAQDAGFIIEHVKALHQTPAAVAAERADEVVFVLKEVVREFDETGTPENPPDRIRQGLGLPIPRKQMIQAGAMRTMVDIVPALPDDTF